MMVLCSVAAGWYLAVSPELNRFVTDRNPPFSGEGVTLILSGAVPKFLAVLSN